MHLWRWRSPVCSRSQAHPIIGNDFFTFSTDHKVIGIQYIVTAFVFFLFAGLLAMIMRGELITPEADLVDRTVYNGLFTMHGTLMLFMWTFPMLNGLANYLVPLMIGARDMAFPRLNAAAFWLVPVFGTILTASFFHPWWPVAVRLVGLSARESAKSHGQLDQRATVVAGGGGAVGRVIHHGCSQYCHHHLSDAGTGHGLVQNASFLLDGTRGAAHSALWPPRPHRWCSDAAV